MRNTMSGWALGIICIVLVAIDWSASSVLVQAIFAMDFKKPFFLTWVGNSLFAILLPLKLLTHFAQKLARPVGQENAMESLTGDAQTARNARASAVSGAKIAPIWFLANLSYNYSMSLTSITSSTIISSSSAAFTLLFSVLFIGERPTRTHRQAEALALVGRVALCP